MAASRRWCLVVAWYGRDYWVAQVGACIIEMGRRGKGTSRGQGRSKGEDDGDDGIKLENKSAQTINGSTNVTVD